MHFPEIKIPNVADTTVEYFEELILSGVLTPGLIMPAERKLSELLDISRTSLRTAYDKLEAKGLIERKPQGVQVRGIFDVLISQPLKSLFYLDNEELFEMWKVLFGASLATACARRTKQDLNHLNECLRQVREGFETSDKAILQQSIHDFFKLIASTTYNFLLNQVLNVVNQTMEPSFAQMSKDVCASKEKIALLDKHVSEMILAFERSDTDKAFKEFSVFCVWLEYCCLKQDPRSAKTDYDQRVEVMAPSAHATAELSKSLTSGDYKVGDILPCAQVISNNLGITPASTKAALTKLETLGVIERDKRDGTIIRSLTIQDTKDPLLDILVKNQRHLESVIEFRIILEEQTAYLAAQRCTPDLLRKLHKRLAMLEEKLNDEDDEHYAHLDIDFHKTIAALSGNAGLRVITSALVDLFETATSRWLSVYHDLTGGLSMIHDQHITIYEAIAAQEPIGAMRAMNEHLSYVITMTRSFNDIEHREDVAALRDSLRAPNSD